jgi:hypothetical protein
LLGFNLHAQWLRLHLYLAQGAGFRDPACDFAYCDYSLFWLAGRLARQGATATLYHGPAFFAFAARTIPHHIVHLPFLYPPTVLLPASLMSLPGLAAGYYGFSLLVLGVSLWLLRLARLPWWCIAIGLLSPAAMWSLYLGQFGLPCAALLICGLVRLETQPKRAGGLLACLAIKPQYALLVPIAVLAGRNGRAVLAGGNALALIVAASIAAFGWPGWLAFLGPGRATAKALLEAPFGPGYEQMGVSVFWMCRSFGAAVPLAYALQAIAALSCAVTAWRLWWKPTADPMARVAVTVFLTLLASPYGFVDDLTGYSLMLPLLARRNAPWRNICLAILWLAPAFILTFVKTFEFLPTPFLVLAALMLARPRAPAPRKSKVFASFFKKKRLLPNP